MRYPDLNGETHKSKPKFAEHLTENLNVKPAERKLTTLEKRNFKKFEKVNYFNDPWTV
jgi:hypothetical protein